MIRTRRLFTCNPIPAYVCGSRGSARAGLSGRDARRVRSWPRRVQLRRGRELDPDEVRIRGCVSVCISLKVGGKWPIMSFEADLHINCVGIGVNVAAITVLNKVLTVISVLRVLPASLGDLSFNMSACNVLATGRSRELEIKELFFFA